MKVYLQQHNNVNYITYSLDVMSDFTFKVPSNTKISDIMNIGYLFAANAKNDEATENIINYTVPSSWTYLG